MPFQKVSNIKITYFSTKLIFNQFFGKAKTNLQHVTKRMVSSVEHFDHWEGM